jgi:hypothetical protein
MDWKSPIRARAASTGRALYESPLGLGIDFPDGCDAFWILPGEVTSTLPVPAAGPESVDNLLAAYDRIGHLRDRALHVVRHYLASKQVRLTPRPSGQWGIEWAGGSSSSLSVGAHLTAVARDTNDVYAMVRAVLEHSWVGKVPSRRRIDRYLDTPGLPAPDPVPSSATRELPGTIRTTLAWMGVCNAVHHADEIDSEKALKSRVVPDGRIGQTLLRLADRLPTVESSVDLLKPGTLGIEFDDGHASFDVRARSRDLVRRIAASTPQAVGDQLADEFLALNAARARTLRAIRQAAAARAWRKQEFNLRFLVSLHEIHLGHTHREVTFDPGDALTDKLRTAPPETVLRQLFAAHPAFADACVAALNNPLPDDRIDLPDGELAPRNLPAAPPLCELDVDIISDLDRFAAKTLHAHLAVTRTIWEYRTSDSYDPAIDTWATLTDWLAVAERHLDLDKEWPHPVAILILLDQDDPRGDALARAYLAKAEPHHEVSDAEVEIVWRYRHALPDVASRWFAPAQFNDVPFADYRAPLGDPLAQRHTTVDEASQDAAADEDDLDSLSPAALDHLDPTRRERLHQALFGWARTTYRWSPPDAGRLRVALRMNWPDVADALAENPFMLGGLLTRGRRGEQMDEPGLLLGKDLVLVWSRLSPSPFLARLLATAHQTDLLAEAEKAARASVAAKPHTASGLNPALDAYRAWLKDFHVALAITWTRCRRRMP